MALPAILCASLLVGCGAEPPAEEHVRVLAQTVKMAEFASATSITGDIQARVQADQSFRVGGKIVERLVDVGDHVAAGQVLARLDPQDQRSNVENAQAAVAAQQAQSKLADLNYQRQKALLPKGYTSQSEYDQALYGAEKKVQLPFVMGVMADLAGKPAEPQAAVADRKFLEIDVDNFDARLKAMKPRVAFNVPNVLTGEGNLSLDITFESMDDFSPAAVARKVDSLNKLLEARTQLANLLTYMDGKTGAEEMIMKAIKDPALLQALASAPKPKDDEPQA